MKHAASIAATAVLALLCLRAVAAEPRADWHNMRVAALAYLSGIGGGGEPGERLYDSLEMQRWVDRAGHGDALATYVPQTPAALLPYAPFAPLASRAGKVAFACVSLAAFLVATAGLARTLGAGSRDILLCLWSVGGSITANLDGGQQMLLVAAALQVAAAWWIGGRPAAAGAATGAALGLKLFGIPWLVLFALRGRLRPLGAAAVATVALLLAAGAGLGIAALRDWSVRILPASLDGSFHDLWHPASQSVESMLRRLLLPHPDWNVAPPFPSPAWYGALSRGTPILLLGIGLASAWRALPDRPALALGVPIPLLLLAAPTVTRYHLAPVAILTLAMLRAAPRSPATWIALGGTALASWCPAVPWVREPRVLGLLATSVAALGLVRPNLRGAALATVAAAGAAVAFPVVREGPPSGWHRITRVPFQPIVARLPSRDGSALELTYRAGPRGTLFSWPGYARDRSLAGDVLLERMTEDGRSGVLHEDASGRQTWLLRLPDADVRFPRWHGQDVLVTLERGGTREPLLLRPAAGSAGPPGADLDPGPLPPGIVGAPDISPDGRHAAFAVARGSRTEIRERERASGRERVLVAAVAWSQDPRYSWDGKSLFFASDAGRCAGCPVVYRIPR